MKGSVLRTYILYVNDEEKYRGILPDCTGWINENLNYANVNLVSLVLMLPSCARYSDLNATQREIIKSVLTLSDRLQFNATVEYAFMTNKVRR
jgi:hypothetical protein